MDRRAMLAGTAAALLSTGAPKAADIPRTWSVPFAPSLARAAARKGRRYGAAVRPDQLQVDPQLSAALLRDCSQLTPEIHLKWDALEPEPGHYVDGPMEALLALARRHDLEVQGQALLWDQSTPAWAKNEIKATADWTPVGRHIRRTLVRYADRIPVWAVVNEPVDVEAADGLRRTTFRRAFGPGYIERALREAADAAPRARLMINDYGFDYENPVEQARRAAFLKLLRRLKEAGAPLHAVGLQAHLDLSKGPIREAPLARFMHDLAQLDLEIAVTELDVKEVDYDAPLDERDQRVAAEVGRYLAVVLDQPAVTNVSTWGLTDRYSWLEGPDELSRAGQAVATTPERFNRGLPYDASVRPKPLYWTLHDALSAATPARRA